MVVKPPGPAPCSILEMGPILKEAGVPDGVINIVPTPFADEEAGEVMTSHPGECPDAPNWGAQ